MPSSRDSAARRLDLVESWQPDELAAVRSPLRAAPDPVPVVDRPLLFEVTPVRTLPDAAISLARRSAESAGYAEGWASGQLAARAAAEASVQRVRDEITRTAEQTRATAERTLTALTAAAEALDRRSTPALAQLQDLIVASAFEIAEAVVGSVLRHDPDRGAHAVARALSLVPDGTDVTVSLHPDDLHSVARAGDTAATIAGVTLVADPSLAPGDAVAQTGTSRVDARVAAGLARVKEALAP